MTYGGRLTHEIMYDKTIIKGKDLKKFNLLQMRQQKNMVYATNFTWTQKMSYRGFFTWTAYAHKKTNNGYIA